MGHPLHLDVDLWMAPLLLSANQMLDTEIDQSTELSAGTSSSLFPHHLTSFATTQPAGAARDGMNDELGLPFWISTFINVGRLFWGSSLSLVSIQYSTVPYGTTGGSVMVRRSQYQSVRELLSPPMRMASEHLSRQTFISATLNNSSASYNGT
jgi:hypothetical protein